MQKKQVSLLLTHLWLKLQQPEKIKLGKNYDGCWKNDVEININSLSLNIGGHKVLEKGQLVKNYSEQTLKDYMKSNLIKISWNEFR